MPALSSYTRRGQNNPWGRPFWVDGSSGGFGLPNPAPDPVSGPYMAFGTEFWVNTNGCLTGFDVDADPQADIWLTKDQVCAGDLDQNVKNAISAQLEALGCGTLPCSTL